MSAKPLFVNFIIQRQQKVRDRIKKMLFFHKMCKMIIVIHNSKMAIQDNLRSSVLLMLKLRQLHCVSKKLCQCYFLNNSVKHWPMLIIFGTQHHEVT